MRIDLIPAVPVNGEKPTAANSVEKGGSAPKGAFFAEMNQLCGEPAETTKETCQSAGNAPARDAAELDGNQTSMSGTTVVHAESPDKLQVSGPVVRKPGSGTKGVIAAKTAGRAKAMVNKSAKPQTKPVAVTAMPLVSLPSQDCQAQVIEMPTPGCLPASPDNLTASSKEPQAAEPVPDSKGQPTAKPATTTLVNGLVQQDASQKTPGASTSNAPGLTLSRPAGASLPDCRNGFPAAAPSASGAALEPAAEVALMPGDRSVSDTGTTNVQVPAPQLSASGRELNQGNGIVQALRTTATPPVIGATSQMPPSDAAARSIVAGNAGRLTVKSVDSDAPGTSAGTLDETSNHAESQQQPLSPDVRQSTAGSRSASGVFTPPLGTKDTLPMSEPALQTPPSETTARSFAIGNAGRPTVKSADDDAPGAGPRTFDEALNSGGSQRQPAPLDARPLPPGSQAATSALRPQVVTLPSIGVEQETSAEDASGVGKKDVRQLQPGLSEFSVVIPNSSSLSQGSTVVGSASMVRTPTVSTEAREAPPASSGPARQVDSDGMPAATGKEPVSDKSASDPLDRQGLASPSMKFKESEPGMEAGRSGRQVPEEQGSESTSRAFANSSVVSGKNDAPPQAPAQAEGARSSEFFMQLAERFQVLVRNNANGEIHIQLRPENLGKLDIRAEAGAHGVIARIAAESDIVKGFLESNLHTLQQSFHDQGLKVERIDVLLQGSFDARHPAAHQQQSGQQGSSGQQSGSGTPSSAGSRREAVRDEILEDTALLRYLGPNSTFHTTA